MRGLVAILSRGHSGRGSLEVVVVVGGCVLGDVGRDEWARLEAESAENIKLRALQPQLQVVRDPMMMSRRSKKEQLEIRVSEGNGSRGGLRIHGWPSSTSS